MLPKSLGAELFDETVEELEVLDVSSGDFDLIKRSFWMMTEGLDVRLEGFSRRERFDAESFGGGANFLGAEVDGVGVDDEVDGFLVEGVFDADLRVLARLSK